MNAVTLNYAKQNLEQILEQVISNVEPTIICTDSNQQIVLLPLDEFNSWQETRYLLSTRLMPNTCGSLFSRQKWAKLSNGS